MIIRPILAAIGALLHVVSVTGDYDAPFYTAAVVEYSALGNRSVNTPQDILLLNANNYLHYIKQAASAKVDIIVFPECGLSTIYLPTNRSEIRPFLTSIPDPKKEDINPCVDSATDVSEVLKILSCAALNASLYVVVNLPEIQECEGMGCPDDEAFFYNTDIAFDRKGKLIARYRKYNLFGEPGFDITTKPEISTFQTDFGVRFGMSTCFDIFFHDPILQLVKELAITDIVFPVAWFSEMPFLTALQIQSSWSYATNINLLAAGYDDPGNYNGGSGIFAGKNGIMKAIMPLTLHSEYNDPAKNHSNRLLISKVPKKTHTHEEVPELENTTLITNPTNDSERIFYHDYLIPYTTKTINKTQTFTTVCDRELCCEFKIEIETIPSINSTQYRIAVFNGIRIFYGGKTSGIQVCAIIACDNSSLASCGKKPRVTKETTVFKTISIQGKFNNTKSLHMPSTLLKSYMPLNVDSYEMLSKSHAENLTQIYLHTTKEIKNLLTFGIYSREYGLDGLPFTEF
ncbi:Vanin-like protein 2 [Blattella germanica]|nr:Vanin-like protein 2 [Blattella germanica]